jgi:hypothetical protein
MPASTTSRTTTSSTRLKNSPSTKPRTLPESLLQRQLTGGVTSWESDSADAGAVHEDSMPLADDLYQQLQRHHIITRSKRAALEDVMTSYSGANPSDRDFITPYRKSLSKSFRYSSADTTA